MKSATEEKVTAPTIQERIAALPDDQFKRTKALEALEKELEDNLSLVRDEQKKMMRYAIENNMTPDEKVLTGILVLTGIMDRYSLSIEYGVTREDFDTVLNEIRANETTLLKLSRLDTIGAAMTITSVTDEEIILIDTADNVNVEAQEEFLSGLDGKERSDTVSTLEQRFPRIERLLQKAYGYIGLNYYEYLLICEVTGAKPMPEAEYRKLQDRKPVDLHAYCWLLTEQKTLDGGCALYGGLDVDRVVVYGSDAGDHCVRAGRPMLRVQRA